MPCAIVARKMTNFIMSLSERYQYTPVKVDKNGQLCATIGLNAGIYARDCLAIAHFEFWSSAGIVYTIEYMTPRDKIERIRSSEYLMHIIHTQGYAYLTMNAQSKATWEFPMSNLARKGVLYV